MGNFAPQTVFNSDICGGCGDVGSHDLIAAVYEKCRAGRVSQSGLSVCQHPEVGRQNRKWIDPHEVNETTWSHVTAAPYVGHVIKSVRL